MPKLTLKIEKLNSSGHGLARDKGKVYFVPMAVPGDVVIARVEKEHKNYADACIVDFIEKSSDRVEPRCPYFIDCGGCQLQHMSYQGQLKWKRVIVEDALKKISHMTHPNVPEVIPSPHQWHYRNRVQLHKGQNGRIGFYQAKSHQILEISECLIAMKEINQKIDNFRQDGVQKTSSRFEIRLDSFSSFSQINSFSNQLLINAVVELLAPLPDENIFDLYCGNGNLTIPLVDKVGHIWGIEKDQQAIKQAMKECEQKGIQNITWIEDTTKRGLEELHQRRIICHKMIVDPPRRGMEDDIEGLLLFKPKKIVYVSCDQATFARDAQYLIGQQYKLEKCQPIDMFPQTSHIEVVGLFTPSDQ